MTRVALASSVLCLLLLGIAPVAQNQPESKPAGVAGEWEITFDDPHLKGPVILSLKQEGDKVGGTYGRTSGKGEKLSGTLRGQDLKLTGGNRIIPIELSAILDGDLLKGTTRVAGRGVTWTAKRKGGKTPVSPRPPAVE